MSSFHRKRMNTNFLQKKKIIFIFSNNKLKIMKINIERISRQYKENTQIFSATR